MRISKILKKVFTTTLTGVMFFSTSLAAPNSTFVRKFDANADSTDVDSFG